MFHIIFSRRALQKAAPRRIDIAAGIEKDGYFGWTDRYGIRRGDEFAKPANGSNFFGKR